MQTILKDLELSGYVSRSKVGRRNRYDLHTDHPMRHPVEAGHHVRALLDAMTDVSGSDPAG